MSFISNVESVLKENASDLTLSYFFGDKTNEFAYPKQKVRFFYTLSQLEEAALDGHTKIGSEEESWSLNAYLLPKLLIDALNARSAWISEDFNNLKDRRVISAKPFFDRKELSLKADEKVSLLSPDDMKKFWGRYNMNQKSDDFKALQLVNYSFEPHVLTDFVAVPCGSSAYEVCQSGSISGHLAAFACAEMDTAIKPFMVACSKIKDRKVLEWAKGEIK